MRQTSFIPVSSSDWSLNEGTLDDSRVEQILGVSYSELEVRCRKAVEEFIVGTYDADVGAVHHYYSASEKRMDEFDSGNFLIAMSFITMYDRYGDEEMLTRAENCYQWAYKNCTETHPMFSWQGGVRDGFNPKELYVKYTADALTTLLALYARRPKEIYKLHIAQYHSFLKRARQAGFMFTYDRANYQWRNFGFSWNGFGGPVLAYLQAHELFGEARYLEEAKLWGENALGLQSDDGCFYLLDREFWNSDLTPLEMRALVHLFEVTSDSRYLEAAKRFADWVLKNQRHDGAWPIGIDQEGEVCAPNVGPGDMPNIAMSLIKLHMVDAQPKYLESAILAIRYAISQQVLPGCPYWEDSRARWGFWSWDPGYDFSLSGDQVVHHVRGIMLVADYIGRSR